MIDEAEFLVEGGAGGAGAVSFLRRVETIKAPPNGGSGGQGGDVHLLSSTERNTLLDFRFQKTFRAKSGERGGVSDKNGRGGEDLVLKVPIGTQVYWDGELISDLSQPGQRVLVAQGGQGGRGNKYFKTKYDRMPHFAEPGGKGEVKKLRLELKLLADVGIVGLPNAGKSTLLSQLTAAQPKIGAYPFTTLEPNLGVMVWKGKSAVLADIPGLIEGAAEGRGLGHDFLRHVERTRVLVHLTSSWNDYQVIRHELGQYSPGLLKKKEIVVLSKTDSLTEEDKKAKLIGLKSRRLRPLALSSATGEGLEELRNRIIENL